MIRSMMATVLFLSLTRVGSAQSSPQARIREAIKLPQLSVNFQFSYHLGTQSGSSESPTAQLAAFQQAIHGVPADAHNYIKIGQLYRSAPWNDDVRAQTAFQKAISLLRKQVSVQPQNGWATTELGMALFETGQRAEAEKKLREATRVSPEDWRTWAELGRFVQNSSLFGSGKVVDLPFTDPAAVRQKLAAYLSKNALPEHITMLQKASAEARADFDRAVALKPSAPEPYEYRAAFTYVDQCVTQNLIDSGQGKPASSVGAAPPGVLEDMWKAADLAPDDASRQAFVATCVLMWSVGDTADRMDPPRPGAIDRLSPVSRDHIQVVMLRLRKLVEDKNPQKAKFAVFTLAFLNFFNGDMVETERLAKRALAMDPQNKSAWELLCGVYISAGRYKEFATAQEDRLKHNDTPSNRLVLAKIYDHLSNSALASRLVLSAVQRFPNDLLVNLASVDVLLKRTQPDAVKQAGTSMAHAETLFSKMSGEDRKNNQTNMDLTRGVYLARTGKAAAAKQFMQSVLTEDAENEEAKSIVAILNGSH